MTTDSFQYPPELFELIVSTVPLLNRSKKSVLLFFKGAGVQDFVLADLEEIVSTDKESINKFEITRTILTRINEKSESFLKERREVLKRIIEFEAFETCWPTDQWEAKGRVSEIRKIVNVRDAFTRMQQERDTEQRIRTQAYQNKVNEIQKRNEEIEQIKKEFYALFAETNPQLRGKKLEDILNCIFRFYNILVREAFTRKGDEGEGIIEQIDGVVEIDNYIYLVEMKWKKEPIGSDDIYAHLGRIYHRSNASGIFISASGYSASGITAAKEALLKNGLLVLVELEEFVNVLENKIDLVEYIKSKIRSCIIDKNPHIRPNF